MKAPSDCATMSDLRQQIDTLDKLMIQLLTQRTAYIDRAAELKPLEGLPARISDRVEQVARNVRENASDAGFDPDLANSGLLSGAMTYEANAEEAVQVGAFGAPFYLVDGKEGFWGQDRLEMLDRYLSGKLT